jgi:phosphinothricin acetyltransferase
MVLLTPMVPFAIGSGAWQGAEGFLAIRAARESDLTDILAIYNHAVVNTTATFDLEPRTAEAQEAWFVEHVPPHPAIVWEEEGRLLGWASISPYHSRCAYRFTGEASVYVAPDAHRRGIGEGLLREIIALGARYDYHSLVGGITEENVASSRLAEKVGFRRVGTLDEVGYKFDRWLNVTMYQYVYGPAADES